MKSQQRLLIWFLDLDETHGRTGHRFTDRCRIGRIRLAAFDIGFDVERGHQPNFVPELADLARPVMGGGVAKVGT